MASFYGFEPENPLFLGTAQYPSPFILAEAVKRSGGKQDRDDGRDAL